MANDEHVAVLGPRRWRRGMHGVLKTAKRRTSPAPVCEGSI
jgi:hypothetical protein